MNRYKPGELVIYALTVPGVWIVMHWTGIFRATAYEIALVSTATAMGWLLRSLEEPRQ